MNIKYSFVNGESVEIEVDEKWKNIIDELNRKENNNNHKEKRRHLSYDTNPEAGEWLADEEQDPAYIFEVEIEKNRIRGAFGKLNDNQKKLVWDIFVEEKGINTVAGENGVDHSAISHRVERIQKKIKKFL